MSDCLEISAIHHLVAEGRHALADERLTELFGQEGVNPEFSHFAGLYYFWQAVDAEKKNPGVSAERLWNLAIPHIVLAFEDREYLDRFRLARDAVFGQKQGITPDKVVIARDTAYEFIGSTIAELGKGYAESRREDDLGRIQRISDRWSLEKLAAQLVWRIGGIPVDEQGRTAVFGPAYARLRGLYETTHRYIAQIEVRERSLFDEFLILLSEHEGDESGVTLQSKRKAAYCFSPLDMAFLYFNDKQFSKALDALSLLSESALGDDAASGGQMREAAQRRSDARRLAMGIRVAVGGELLRKSSGQTGEAFAYWSEALKDADALDKTSSLMEQQGEQIREQMQGTITEQVEHLRREDKWSEAVALAEGLARLIPRESSLSGLVMLLLSYAAHSANEHDDYRMAATLLRRARLLAPDNMIAARNLPMVLLHYTHELMEKSEYRAAVEHALDVVSTAREVLARNEDDSDAKQATLIATSWLVDMADKLDPEADADVLHFISAAAAAEAGVIPSVMYSQIEAARYANRAFDRAKKGEFVDAFEDAEEALRRSKDDDQVLALHEAIGARAVDELCDKGELDRAGEIADRAAQARPDSKRLERARTRVMFRRIDPLRVLREDAEEVGGMVTMFDNWMGVNEQEAELRRRSSRYAAIADPRLQAEALLERASKLMGKECYRDALAILQRVGTEGPNALGARVRINRCYQMLGELENALASANALQEDFPEYAVALLCHARVMALMGRFDEAEEEFARYREFDDDDQITFEMALNAYRAGRFEDAVKQMRTARRQGSQEIEGYLCECLCLAHLGREGEIRSVLNGAPESHKTNPWCMQLYRWLQNLVSDDELLGSAKAKEQQIDVFYWVGDRLRAHGRIAEGCQLMLKCVALGLPQHHEHQHVVAMKLGGTFEVPNGDRRGTG